jgi:hypothetical protein
MAERSWEYHPANIDLRGCPECGLFTPAGELCRNGAKYGDKKKEAHDLALLSLPTIVARQGDGILTIARLLLRRWETDLTQSTIPKEERDQILEELRMVIRTLDNQDLITPHPKEDPRMD